RSGLAAGQAGRGRKAGYGAWEMDESSGGGTGSAEFIPPGWAFAAFEMLGMNGDGSGHQSRRTGGGMNSALPVRSRLGLLLAFGGDAGVFHLVAVVLDLQFEASPGGAGEGLARLERVA